MKHFRQTLVTFLVILANAYAPMAMADTSTASFTVTGNIPTIFSVTAVGYPGDLDLFGSTIVVNRLLGTFHFRMNEAPTSIKLSSAQTTGLPSTAANVAYTFTAASFLLNMTGCASVTVAAFDPTAVGKLIGTAPVDVKGAVPTTTIDEYCDVTASWTNGATIPLAGKYNYALTMTMVAP